jgi:hypothetical protein
MNLLHHAYLLYRTNSLYKENKKNIEDLNNQKAQGTGLSSE